MIGSRETPEDIAALLVLFAEKACKEGWIGRSGGAQGADSCLESGVHNVLQSRGTGFLEDHLEVYLPWNNFKYYTLYSMRNRSQAEKIASETHPAWERCKEGAKKLHTRNVYQVLGQDLATPSRFVICWAKPVGDKGHVQGGTATAVKLALDNGIEVINLYHQEHCRRIEGWVI